jgi:hypothetical protein
MAMEAAARPWHNGTGGGATFINGNTQNVVSRSRYGRKAIGNMTKEIAPARNLVAATSMSYWFLLWIMNLVGVLFQVDPEVKRRIDAAIAESKQGIVMCDEERKQLDEEMKSVLEGDKEFEKRAVSYFLSASFTHA